MASTLLFFPPFSQLPGKKKAVTLTLISQHNSLKLSVPSYRAPLPRNADGGTWTRTKSPSSDFESDASAIPPHPLFSRQKLYYHIISKIASLFFIFPEKLPPSFMTSFRISFFFVSPVDSLPMIRYHWISHIRSVSTPFQKRWNVQSIHSLICTRQPYGK